MNRMGVTDGLEEIGGGSEGLPAGARRRSEATPDRVGRCCRAAEILAGTSRARFRPVRAARDASRAVGVITAKQQLGPTIK